MSFIASQLLWLVTAPASLLFFAILGAWVLQRWLPRLSRFLLAGSALFLLALSCMPVGSWSLALLEDRFAAPKLTQPVDGIIVLGGALSPEASAQVGQPVLNDSAERLTEMVALARRYPDAKLLFTGGSGNWRRPDAREADQVGPFLASPMDPSRVMFERDSRNTWQNAVDAKRLLKPGEDETWLLITSAWHMPRAVGCFRAAGWKVLPYPVDYRTWPRDEWPWLETLGQLVHFSMAAKEWVGLISYHMMDRTDTWFPAPDGRQ